MTDFTSRKFLQLPLCKQHKICAILLKQIYVEFCQNKDFLPFWENYCKYLKWMNQEIKHVSPTPVSISDLYHEHLQLAKISLKEHNFLPRMRMGDKTSALYESLSASIYLDNLRSAHNVGSIIRTTEAFKLGNLFFSHQTPFIDNLQVVSASMGASEWVSCAKIDNIDKLPRPLIILDTAEEAIPIDHFIFPQSFTLVVGNEEYGCSQNLLSQADVIIEIPLYGRKNSLNVANAFAIAAAEIRRQSQTKWNPDEEKRN